MTSTVTNQSQTLVSFRGNSGESRHIPPHHTITVMTVELTDNEKVRKLEELGFITVQHMAPADTTPRIQEKNNSVRGKKHKH